MAVSKKTRAFINDALSLNAPKERLGLGVDLVEIERMRKICARTPSFTRKLFSDAEVKYCNAKNDPIPHFAVRFAAKEAVLKALGTGFSKGIGYRDVEVKNDRNSAPIVELSGIAKKIADEKGIVEIPISLSHTDKDAVCCAIAITKKSIEERQNSKNTVDELTRQFKDLRLSLDDI